ncbi:ribosome biogenesis GTPase YlqF [Ligilactobacillus agilis]|uniref:ribosome biogenesis GTPase YlqF n=1 Tax=Ligilactobacillus agilis TaxID=1601 RepID=UPI0025A43441|nr:ribosome biogenesis GTPase YlqF [Ligilactobacillus agilis]MDM8279273.1 ribosome biogenesis GTPase YlqF [Ligilactobacillus agilis]
MTTIQWFPGHMAKALRQVKENLKLVDIVLELVDARLPESSRNPQLKELLANKPSILVLTKMDLADPKQTTGWLKYYEEMGQPAVAVNSTQGSLKVIEKKIKEVLADKLAAKEAKGIMNQRIRVMCIGIPNVGKSTLLNHLVKKNVAQVGNKPGVTKSQQWLKAGSSLQLLDTPGILWPKFEDPLVGKKLALTGAIKDTLYNKDDVALYALEYFNDTNPQALMERYKLTQANLDDTTVELLLELTRKMGFKDDYDRASERLIFEIRRGKLGRYTLDFVPVSAAEVKND